MNKLQGFYELNSLGIPTVPWNKFDENTLLDSDMLWTIRTAVLEGDDFNLPRAVGVSNEIAKVKYEAFSKKLNNDDLIIYYPFFVADQSGVIDISKDKIIIEACKSDLWNLINKGLREVTYIITNEGLSFDGHFEFLSDGQIKELTKYVPLIKNKYRDQLFGGKSVILEWSYAFDSSTDRNPVGDKYLVFYELRII